MPTMPPPITAISVPTSPSSRGKEGCSAAVPIQTDSICDG
jgi:hypothetical protein